jgi:hypothetical protein
MRNLIALDGHMQFGNETPEEGMYVQVNQYCAEVVEVDQEERVVSVAVHGVYDDDLSELRYYSY